MHACVYVFGGVLGERERLAQLQTLSIYRVDQSPKALSLRAQQATAVYPRGVRCFSQSSQTSSICISCHEFTQMVLNICLLSLGAAGCKTMRNFSQ